MPLPMPHPGESEQDFVGRCISFVVDEGTVDNTEAGRQQGAAMCYQHWRDNKSATVQHACSLLHIKSFNEDERIIEGIATTPTPDRVGDIVEPMGAKFTLPLALLWQHKHDQPVGEIFWAKPTKDGIPFKGRIAKTDEPGTLKSRLDEAWQSIKLKLVRGISIGFRALDMEPINSKDPFGGQRFKEWELLEISAVTVPANVDASIQIIRSIDKGLRAAIGKTQSPVADHPPGDTGSEQTKPAGASASLKTLKTFKIERIANMAKKTNSERIVDLENRRAAEVAAREAIQQKVTDEGRTKDEAEQQAFDEHSATIKGIDRELIDCRLIEAEAKAAAVPVQGQSMELASTSRGGSMRVSTKANRPVGIGMSRVAIAKMAGLILQRDPLMIAQERWPSDDELHAYMKTAVVSINTTSNGEELSVSQNMPAEFVEFLRPRTILGRVPGFRRVPFNITVPRQSAGVSGHWVGEGKAKPLDRPTFDSITLRWAKCATIVVFNQETAKYSNPSVETLVRDDLAQGIAQFLDEQLFDPAVAEVANVSPAAITNGADSDTADGETIAALIGDFTEALANFQNAEVDTEGVVIVMRSALATQISMMMNPLGQQAFPGIGPNGGSIFGLPVYCSTNVGSGRIVFFKPSEILVADDGGVAIDVSTQASLQMDDSPTAAAQSLVSLWQTNMVGIRAERFINWKPRRADAVYLITSANYGTAGTA